jgi:hypothetical protein
VTAPCSRRLDLARNYQLRLGSLETRNYGDEPHQRLALLVFHVVVPSPMEPPGRIEGWEVGADVGNVKNNRPELMERIGRL